MRSIDTRRHKQSPLRDVAGMLRSFSYAAFAALRLVTPDRALDMSVLEQSAAEWERGARRLFLEGYADTTGLALQDPSGALADPLLELLLWDKVCYEIRYELANRPAWIILPLRGLIALLENTRIPEMAEGT